MNETLTDRLSKQMHIVDSCFNEVQTKFVEQIAIKCGCVSPLIRQLPLGEQIELFRDGRCLSVSCRYLCMLQKQVGVCERILGLIPALLSRYQIVCSRPLCPYTKYNIKATPIEQNLLVHMISDTSSFPDILSTALET